MSNGIYDILGKLASLTPKEEPKQEAKPIYESVEARGSMLEGVSAIEAKLQKELVAEKAKNPYAIGMAAAKKQAGITKKHATGLPKDVVVKGHEIAKSIKADESVGTCAECGMNEGECEHTRVEEGDTTDLGGGRRVHKGTYGTEYQGDGDEEEAQANQPKKRGRPAKGTKKVVNKNAPGVRGRPKKASTGFSADAAKSLQDILIGKAPKGKGTKGRVHRLGESVNFKKLMDDTNMTVDEMIASLQNDIKEFKQSGKMSEMLRDFLDIHRHSRSQADEAINPNVPAVFRKQAAAPGEDWMVKQADLDAQRTQHLSSKEGLARRAAELGIDNVYNTQAEESMETDLNELAALAGVARSVQEADAPVAEPKEKPVNAPEPKYGTVKQITSQGDDLNRKKKQFASKPKLGDNPMTPEPTLEAKLQAEYDSIKVTK